MSERTSDSPSAEAWTWAGALGYWAALARAAAAAPDTAEGRRIRETAPDLIMLQAVWLALRHLGDLSPDERALGLDRAEILIERHAARLRARYAEGGPDTEGVEALIADAEAELSRARAAWADHGPRGDRDPETGA